MSQFAKHIVALAQENDLPIRNNQLQKVMYLSLMQGVRGKTISSEWLEQQYDTPFHVWAYGPVIPSIYERYSIYGASSIFRPGQIDNSFDPLNAIIVNNLTLTIHEIIQMVQQQAHWVENKHHIQNGTSPIVYTLENLMDTH